MKKIAGGFSPIISIDRTLAKPLHEQICDAYRAAIRNGNLGAAEKVPSSRELALELGVSRPTVSTAYEQLVAEELFGRRKDPRTRGPPAARGEEAMRLRDELKFEFFFPERGAYRQQLAAELERLDPEWETADGRRVLCGAPLLVAHRVLRSFVDAQLVVAERLAARNPRTPVVEPEFLAECSGVGRQMLLQGRLHGPESLSRELFAGALRLVSNLDLVDPGREELARRRQEWAAQVRDVVGRIMLIDELDATARRETLGVQP